jgi:hypothetical protein
MRSSESELAKLTAQIAHMASHITITTANERGTHTCPIQGHRGLAAGGGWLLEPATAVVGAQSHNSNSNSSSSSSSCGGAGRVCGDTRRVCGVAVLGG